MHQTIVDIPRTKPAASAPQGTVKVPATKAFRFVTRGLEIEGKDPWGDLIECRLGARPTTR